MMEKSIEKKIAILEKFGIRWQKYEKDRIYFDATKLAQALGYDWELYNTGNISYATLNGERISNSEMGRVLTSLQYSKLYYDLVDNKYHWSSGPGIRDQDVKEAISFLKTEVNNIELV